MRDHRDHCCIGGVSRLLNPIDLQPYNSPASFRTPQPQVVINRRCYAHSRRFLTIPQPSPVIIPGHTQQVPKKPPIPPGFFPGTGAVPPRALDVFPFEQQLSKLQLAAKPRGPLTLSRTTAWPLCAWVPWQFNWRYLWSPAIVIFGEPLQVMKQGFESRVDIIGFIIMFYLIVLPIQVRQTCSSFGEHDAKLRTITIYHCLQKS